MILVNGCYLCKRDADHMLLWCPFAYLKKKNCGVLLPIKELVVRKSMLA